MENVRYLLVKDKKTGQKPGSDRKGKNFDEQQNVME